MLSFNWHWFLYVCFSSPPPPNCQVHTKHVLYLSQIATHDLEYCIASFDFNLFKSLIFGLFIRYIKHKRLDILFLDLEAY